MSRVTNVILTTMLVDRDNVAKLNELNEIAQGSNKPDLKWFSAISCNNSSIRWYGGDVPLDMNICIGAMNGLELDKMVLAMRNVPWVAPDCVQLIVAKQDDECFVEVDWQHSFAPALVVGGLHVG